jgi:hypothetical protein
MVQDQNQDLLLAHRSLLGASLLSEEKKGKIRLVDTISRDGMRARGDNFYKTLQFANPFLTGSPLCLYSSEVFTRFLGGFDTYASVLLTSSGFLFKQ